MPSVEKLDDYLRISGFGEDWMVLPREKMPRGYGLQGEWFWVRYSTGELEVHHAPTRRLVGTLPVSPEVHLFRTYSVPAHDGTRLFLFDAVSKESGVLLVIDLPAAHVLRRIEGLPTFIRHRPAERADGRLVVVSFLRRPNGAATTVSLIDPDTGARADTALAEPPDNLEFSNTGFRDLSPDGRHLLRIDHTRLPRRVEVSKGGLFGFGKKERVPVYGLTFQFWSVEPLCFLRRIVVAWLRPDELPDQTYLSPTGREREDPKACQEGLKARQQVWDVIAETSERLQAEPFAPGAPRAAYPPVVVADDKLWDGVQKNLKEVVSRWGDTVRWQPDGGAFWVDVNGFLTCVGLDGMVSPRLYLERLGLRDGTWLPCAINPRELTPLPDRKAYGRYPDGRATLDGAAQPETIEPRAIPKTEDKWVDAAALAEQTAREAAHVAARAMSQDRRRIVVPLAGWDEASVAAAMDTLVLLMGPELFQRSSDSHIELVFQHDKETASEPEFFIAVRERFPGAVSALQRLVEAYVKACQPDRFLFSVGEDGAGLFANAVLSLGLLDRGAIPILIRYGRLVDAGHEYFFAGQTVPAVLKHHGWDDEALEFAFWVLIRNYYNTLDDYNHVWREWGMRAAAVERDPVVLAEHIVSRFEAELFDEPYRNAFGRGGMKQLARQIPKPWPVWETAFFAEVERRLREPLLA